MTDHKASIKIEFSMYGFTEKSDMYINYTEDCGLPDHRVVDWFAGAIDRLKARRLLAETDSDE